MGHTMQVKLLGVRGTLPVHGPEFARFGGATSCVLVRAGGETILFDAGTGLSGRAWRDFFPEKHGTLLITHAMWTTSWGCLCSRSCLIPLPGATFISKPGRGVPDGSRSRPSCPRPSGPSAPTV